MKKLFSIAVILSFVAFSNTAFASALKPADVSQECYTNYTHGSTDGCTPAELQSADNANGVATQNSSVINQGQGAQIRNQGVNASANPATQYVAPTQTSAPAQTTAPNSNVGPGGNLTYTPLEPFCNGTYCATQYGGNGGATFVQYVQNTYQILVTLGGILAVVILVIGGIRYMLSEATHDLESSKKQMTAAVWGLVIVVGSFLILYTLNPTLLKFSLNPQGVATQALTPSPFTTPAQNTALNNSILPAYQYNDQNSTDASVLTARYKFDSQCQGSGGTPHLAPGSTPGTSAETCMITPGLGAY